MARVTMSDVAQLAEVDRSTVSRVLSGNPSVTQRYAPKTVSRIQQAATQLDYRPSQIGIALRTGKTMLLGMIVSDIANTFFGELVAQVEAAVRPRGYRMLVCNSGEHPDLQAEHLSGLIDQGVDAILFSPSGMTGIDEARKADVPLVTLDRPLPGAGLPHVGLDQRRAGQLLGEHLHERGYHQVGVVMPRAATDTTVAQRLEGLQHGLGGSGGVCWVEQIPNAHLREDTRRRVLRRLEQGQMPQAVIGLTYYATIGAFQAMADRKLAIPEQLGIAGVDDFDSATILTPSITVVAQPLAQMARKAADLLLESLEGGSVTPTEPAIHLLEPRLRIRESL